MLETIFVQEGSDIFDQNASFCCQQCDMTNDIMKDAPKNPMLTTINDME
jgi:hypothetical protein